MATLLIDLEIDYHLNVADNLTLYMTVDKLNIDFANYYNNTVKVSLLLIRTEIGVAEPIIIALINKFTEGGLDLNGLIAKTPLAFFNLT